MLVAGDGRPNGPDAANRWSRVGRPVSDPPVAFRGAASRPTSGHEQLAIDPDLLHDEFRRVLDLRDLLAVLVHLHVERAHQADAVGEYALEFWLIGRHEGWEDSQARAGQTRIELRDQIAAADPRLEIFCHRRKVVEL